MSRAVRHAPAAVVGLLAGSFATAQSAAPSTVAQDDRLEEVIVTGEKFSRSLQQTTTSVSVTTAARIEEENLQRLQDVYDRAANVSETYGSAGFTIRGIANNGVSGAGNAPLATVYLDGAALPASVLYGAPTDLWDVQQVEILRGPQSTLQGLNTLAGAVLLRSADPGSAFNARGRVYLTDEQDRAYSLAVGGPVLGEELGARLAVERRDDEGYIRNITRNAPEDSLQSTNVRGVLRWMPAALAGFSARLGFTHFERDGGYSFMYADTKVADFFDHRINASDVPNTGDIDIDIATLELAYELDPALSLSSVTSYNDASERTTYDGDYSAASLGDGSQDRDYQTFSQELRLAYRSDAVSGLLGAFFYKRDQVFGNDARTRISTPVGTISALLQGNGLPAATATQVATLYGAALPVIPVDYTSLGTSGVRTYALFGDGRWKFAPRWSLLAGFRWDHERNTTQVNSTSRFAGAYPDPGSFGTAGSPLYLAVAGINQAVGQLVAQAGAITPSATRDFDAFLPKLGIGYELTPDATLSLVGQRGYRSGGSSENIARATVNPFDPEYSWNYELSLRTAWLDDRLVVNANAFYVDWRHQQVSVNFGLNTYDYHTVNAGKSHLYGFEVEIAHRPARAFDWYVSLGTVRTKFDDFDVTVGAVDDLSGKEFIYAPRITLGAGANLRFGAGFVANVNASYRDQVFTDVGADQSIYRVGARTLVNARVGYEREHWGAHLVGSNLFDEHYIQYDNTTLGMAVLGAPRVLGVTLEARF